jgi:hypothetical protein
MAAKGALIVPALAEARGVATTLLTVRGTSMSWGVPGAAVIGVERFSDWLGEHPLDVAPLLGQAEVSDTDARVVVLQVERTPLPLLARGALSLLQTTPQHLLALPAAFHAAAPLVDQVALIDGAPSVFVLSPQRLLEVWRSPNRLALADSPPASPR